MRSLLAFVAAAVTAAIAADVDACPGYQASNVETKGSSLSADLTLAGTACNVYGEDVKTLKLQVDYETDTRIHVKITDPAHDRYEVPESVFPRPQSEGVAPSKAAIQFKYTSSPFSFSIVRANSGEVLFSTAKHPIVFEPQYLRLATDLPANPNIYGLGEHTDSFRLPTYNYTRTLWSRDAYGIANGTNLYGNHPIYFEHRTSGTHGVFFLNSNGLDVKINSTSPSSPATLEYNSLGGVFDFYFLAGSTSDPTELARQYAELAHTPAEVPYWSLGFHQCRFGYKDYVDVANVITNYSAAKIPLETMWTDIDYMDRRRVFTFDPDYFPISRVREIVEYLHSHDQQYIVMVDPAVAYLPNETTPSAYTRGTEAGIWVKDANGTDLKAIVWPGVTVYPDWFNDKTQGFWTGEFQRLFNPANGVDLDGVWIDMNEPASFCVYPCTNPAQQAIEQGLPPNRTTPPPAPDTPIFGRSAAQPVRVKRAYHGAQENLREPAYKIANAAGEIGSRTADTDAVHANGLVEYDTHNLYGTMMSSATRNAMEARRPGKRTLIITRSTFAGAGKEVGKWLGDNLSTWWHYRVSIAGMLGFASIYQLPMVGSDICGFGGNTTETLCARWAMLGAFNPFMRNHNGDTSISQEFYLWPTVATAARNAIDIRYRLLDYIYTAIHAAHTDGTPILHPLFYKYPKDTNTFGRDLQFFYGDSILVSPVTEENSTTVNAYIPKDIFYDFTTLAPVQGQGTEVAITANFTTIPLHIKSGAVIPMRVSGAMTTKALRKTDFELVVAPDTKGAAFGSLYVDDGESITQKQTTEVQFSYKNGKLSVKGHFDYELGVKLARIRFAGVSSMPKKVRLSSKSGKKDLVFTYDSKAKVVEAALDTPFNNEFDLEFGY